MDNRIYTSSYNIPTGAAPSTASPDPNTMFLAHYRRTAEAAAAASSIRYSSDFDIAPPGVASRISTTNPWANAFPSAAAAVAAAATNVASAASLDLKRSSDALYHPSILSTIGQNEAWYTSNSLAKRPRYETGSTLPIYPQRPGEKDCAHYMLTRTCKFGESCKFDHPIWVPAGGIPDWKEVPNIVPSETLPERPGEPDCPFFLKTQKCKFGTKCKFNHPNVPSENDDVSGLPERPQEPPCAFYLKTGKCKYGAACKFHHPKDIQIQLSDDLSRTVEQTQTNSSVFDGAIGDTQSIMPLISPLSHNSKGLPVRPREVDCPFYMKTGSCKFGASCRYNHPDMNAINPPVSALGPSVLASSTANLNMGAINPAASFYQAFDPSLSNPMSQVGVTGTIYPQRPGQIECDFYMKSGICKFGERCKYHHPIDRTTSLSKLQSNVKLTAAGLPRREGVEICPYYLKTATCKFGATCKFDHPPPGEVMEMAKSQGASTTNGGETETNEDVPVPGSAEKMDKIQDVSYEILNVLEFNSTRKRQSVVCRYPDGKLVLYCKGADNVIYERLVAGSNDIKKVTREHLEQFGSAGLRTLCLAYKELHPDVYESWNEKFLQAKSSLSDREKKLDEVAELIENDLILIGSTAIEDKLQDGVPACIDTLQRAGIKIWVLTGDKIETAINIAYACNLINNEMKQFIISSETDAIREVEDRGDQVETARFIREEVMKELKKCLDEVQSYFSSLSAPKLALVIDGKCLTYALDSSLRVMLLNLSLNCHAVVCCRVSPLQKAQVTTLVKKGARKITLGIGDGANDVSMIQAAHVGVGISGMEGMQAVMASDFAIAQFRYLADLLLVHGRWSYLRICQVVMYFFYKNLTFTLTQFWFNLQTGFSGQRFYDDWFQSLYNVIFTALPVVMVGLYDKDVSASISMKYPELYMDGIRDVFFKWRVVAIRAFLSVYQSLIFFYFVSSSSLSAKNSDGKIFGLWDVSTMAFTCVVVTVNFRLLMNCNSITRWHYISVGGSILGWFLFVFLYSGIRTRYDRQENVYFVIYVLMSTSYFYIMLILVPVAALFCDFLYLGVQRWFFPYDYQIIQELHRHESDDSASVRLLESGNQTPSDERSHEISQLPREVSTHTGFAFDSPGYESFFASQLGIHAPQKAWDVARRASTRSRAKNVQKK